MLWLSCVIALVLVYLMIAFFFRPAVAVGTVVPIAWLIPAWTSIEFAGELLNVKATVAICVLCLYPFLPKATFPIRLVPCDLAMLCLLVVHLVSDSINSGFQWMTPAFAYVEWVVPYLAGRLALQQRDDFIWIWPVLAVVALTLTCAAIFESWFGTNPYELFFGLRPLEGTPRDVLRWGYRRAYATCFHPLYLGVLLCWLYAWLLYPAWRGLTGRASNVWLLLPLLGIFGPLASGSRGPVLAIFVVLLGTAFCYIQKARLGIAILAVALSIAFAFIHNPLLNALDHWSGETQHGRQLKEIELNENVEKFSSARARITLFRIFWTPLSRAGFFGYGSGAVSTFPPNVPTGTDEIHAMRDIWSVDNTYILVTLRFGYLGLICFLSVAVASLLQLVFVSDYQQECSQSFFTACLFGSTFATLVLIFTVWLPADFGFLLIWGFGASSGLYLSQVLPADGS